MANPVLPESRGVLGDRFELGCNYWASHAGVHMWSQWDEAVVRRDLDHLAGLGVSLLRVFPLWPDFQPLELHRTYQGAARELQIDGHPLTAAEIEGGAISPRALEHFKTLADLAHRHGIRLGVGLITGWMSGEIFAPPAFADRNLLTDPLAVKWQIRFARAFVRALRGHPAIAYWEPGNECNGMATVENREQAWHWVNSLAAAIRAEDPSRPVASGMHGIWPGSDREFDPYRKNFWTIQDQGELVDLMTSHPYPHSPSKKPARVDPIGGIRSHFQAVVESRMYADLSGKPCLVEELGVFGPMFADEASKAAFLRMALWNTWAHGASGLLWWCGFEQSALTRSPYDWIAWERELGLFKADHATPKPVAASLAAFGKFLAPLPSPALTPFTRQAVCLLGRSMEASESLENAWSAFLLAKQAGFDLSFSFVGDPLPEGELYLLPGLKEADGISRGEFARILERVEGGGTLYLSIDNASLSPFTEVFGLEVRGREEREGPLAFLFGGHRFETRSALRLSLAPCGAEVLAAEADGNPVFTKHAYGKGEVYLLVAPVEKVLGGKPRAFDGEGADPFYTMYEAFAKGALAKRFLRTGNPEVTATEHPVSNTRVDAVLLNHGAGECALDPVLRPGWRIASTHPPQEIRGGRIKIAARDGVVVHLEGPPT
ncbi:MAG: hypothetical protein J0L75_11725 [Spirochaetes bacterium]|nr:hypothetical protein [Spirochaetota bacterium]